MNGARVDPELITNNAPKINKNTRIGIKKNFLFLIKNFIISKIVSINLIFNLY